MIEMTYCGEWIQDVMRYCGAHNMACPSCLRAHIARLEAALAKERIVVTQITNVMEAQAAAQGVVPGLTDEEVDAYLWDRNHGLVDSDEDWVRWSRRVGRWAYALAVSRLPASRVLRDGEERIGADELAALRGQAGVVVPEPSEFDLREIIAEAGADPTPGVDHCIARASVAWARRKLISLPSPRVLGEGQVAVDPMYLNALILVRGALFEHMATEGGVPMTDALAGAMERIEAHEAALRAQLTEGGA